MSNGVTIANAAFATLMTNGHYGCYFIDVTTGHATPRGTFAEQVVDIAIPLKQ